MIINSRKKKKNHLNFNVFTYTENFSFSFWGFIKTWLPFFVIVAIITLYVTFKHEEPEQS